MKQILVLLAIGVVVGAVVFSGSGCANIVPPIGGPRDSIPPTVVQVHPANKTLYFKDKKIVFTFNEYVELEDTYKNLLISPVPKSFPEVQRKLKTVTLKLKDTLQPNTTYVFNFTDAVKDINEGNKVKDLLYVVSTGDIIDSMQLSGNVRLAQSGKPDSTLVAMLQPTMSDSAVVKQKPKYIARLDSSGTFLFRYLSPGKYKLYALKDEGGTYLYTSPKQLFAFADSPVVISAIPPEPVRLYAYNTEEPTETKILSTSELDKKEKRLKFTTNLAETKQDLLQPFTMNFESALKNFDTSKMVLTQDSTYKKVAGTKITLDSTRTQITLNLPWSEGTKYHLILQKDFASDSINRELLKTDTLSFAAKELKEYGQVKISFLKLDFTRNPVLQIVVGGAVKNAYPIRQQEFELKFYPPGDYDLQILYDTNKNNKWDPGDFFGKRTQPELIVPLDRKLNVKADWTTEFELK